MSVTKPITVPNPVYDIGGLKYPDSDGKPIAGNTI